MHLRSKDLNCVTLWIQVLGKKCMMMGGLFCHGGRSKTNDQFAIGKQIKNLVFGKLFDSNGFEDWLKCVE